jgi:hypothetical protein
MSRIFLDGAEITARVECMYAHDTIRPAIREKIPTQCQGLYDAAQKLRKTVYLCDSHVQDPNLYDSSLLRIFQ